MREKPRIPKGLIFLACLFALPLAHGASAQLQLSLLDRAGLKKTAEELLSVLLRTPGEKRTSIEVANADGKTS